MSHAPYGTIHKWHGRLARAGSSFVKRHKQIIRTNPRLNLVQPYMRQRTQPRGITRIEVITLLAALIIIFALAVVIILVIGNRIRQQALDNYDAFNIEKISQSLLPFSSDFNGSFPSPSLVALPDANGIEDYTLNHSANFYSLMIMRHYVTPQLLISPLEVSDHISEDENYDYNKYDPLNGSYWDDSFVMHIEDPAIGANGSYAHIAAIGDRRNVLQSSKNPSDIPILGTRAYDQSILDPSDFLRSPVFQFSKPHDQWIGNIAFADGHTQTTETFFPLHYSHNPKNDALKDNIFAAEFDHPNGKQAAADAFLCISTAATKYTVKDVYDPLLDE